MSKSFAAETHSPSFDTHNFVNQTRTIALRYCCQQLRDVPAHFHPFQDGRCPIAVDSFDAGYPVVRYFCQQIVRNSKNRTLHNAAWLRLQGRGHRLEGKIAIALAFTDK